MLSQGLLCCFPAATQVTIPTGDIPEALSDPLPVEVEEWKRTRTKDNNDPGMVV